MKMTWATVYNRLSHHYRKDNAMSSELPPPTPYGLQRQFQVYLAGLQGQRPQLPVSPEALEQAANAAMTPEASGYLDGMADSMQANRTAFQHWRIVPRMLRDV